MASNLNSEFNYRYQVMGETPWEKLKHLQNFLEGRKRAAALEEVSAIKRQARYSELQSLKDANALPHLIMNLQADIIEMESSQKDLEHNFALNLREIEIIKKLMNELYVIVEPTRLHHSDGKPYDDDETDVLNIKLYNPITTGFLLKNADSIEEFYKLCNQ